jgi:hypothetical protein
MAVKPPTLSRSARPIYKKVGHTSVKPYPLTIPRSRKFASWNFACSVTMMRKHVLRSNIRCHGHSPVSIPNRGSAKCQTPHMLQPCRLTTCKHRGSSAQSTDNRHAPCCECDLPAHGTPMAFRHAYIALTRLGPVCYQRAKAQHVSF